MCHIVYMTRRLDRVALLDKVAMCRFLIISLEVEYNNKVLFSIRKILLMRILYNLILLPKVAYNTKRIVSNTVVLQWLR